MLASSDQEERERDMDIVAEMRGYESDHEPDGWPAVRMRQISALCDEVERLREALQIASAGLRTIDTLTTSAGRVVLLKRTGPDTVMASIGYRDSSGTVRGWHGRRGPTHWAKAPATSKRFS